MQHGCQGQKLSVIYSPYFYFDAEQLFLTRIVNYLQHYLSTVEREVRVIKTTLQLGAHDRLSLVTFEVGLAGTSARRRSCLSAARAHARLQVFVAARATAA